MVFLEPVGKGEGAVWPEEFGRGRKKSGPVLIVGNGFHRPEKIELTIKIHGFGVHQKESCVQLAFRRGLLGDFDLYGRDGDASDEGCKFLCEVETAGAETATDIENP